MSPTRADQLSLIATCVHARGQKGYGARALVGACLVKALYGLPTWTRVASLIGDHAGLQSALGGTPSVWACYRFTTKLRLHSEVLADCLDRIAASLQVELPGIGRDVAIDGSDLPASPTANGSSAKVAASASGSPTPMHRGATAPLSALAKGAAFTATSFTLRSAHRQACRLLGKWTRRRPPNFTTSHHFSTRSALAATGRKRARWTRDTTTDECMTSANSAA
jgi:hypothetical protein